MERQAPRIGSDRPKTPDRNIRKTTGGDILKTAVCTGGAVLAILGAKDAKAEDPPKPVTEPIGVPFGEEINYVKEEWCDLEGGIGYGFTSAAAAGLMPGEAPNTFKFRYWRRPEGKTCVPNKLHDIWVELDDGPNNAIVVRELGKAEPVPEVYDPEHGNVDYVLEYCIDGANYKIGWGLGDPTWGDDDKLLVNGVPAWVTSPYPDGTENITVLEHIDSSADPTKVKIFAWPFFPEGNWLDNPGYYSTWKVDVSKKNYYDAIQKGIDEAWAQGKDAYEAGLANPLDDKKGSLETSPETDKLLAMARSLNYAHYTYFFSYDSSTNTHTPLQRNAGVWTPEGSAINDGLGNVDFKDASDTCDTMNTPVAAIARETPSGRKMQSFVIAGCEKDWTGTLGHPVLRTLILEEQPNGTFTEPEIIIEPDVNADVSGQNILCVNSPVAPKPDEGAEQAKTAETAEQTATVEESTAEPIIAEQPVIAEQPSQPIAEPMPEPAAEPGPEPSEDVEAENCAEEGTAVAAELPVAAEQPTIAEIPAIAESVIPAPDAGTAEPDAMVLPDIPAQPDAIAPPADTAEFNDTAAEKQDMPKSPDILLGSDTATDIAQDTGPDTQPDANLGPEEILDDASSVEIRTQPAETSTETDAVKRDPGCECAVTEKAPIKLENLIPVALILMAAMRRRLRQFIVH